jgi:hypothetical protein
MDNHTNHAQAERKDFVAAPAPNEEVVSKPPRARVSDAPLPDEAPEETAGAKLERKRDYLEGFLAKKPETAAPGQPGGALYDAVIEALNLRSGNPGKHL